jgi:hypothetical protein
VLCLLLSVQWLHVHGNCTRADGAAMLGFHLEALSLQQKLNLGCNSISDDGATEPQRLCAIITAEPKSAKNSTVDDSDFALNPHLAALLQCLDLRHNHVGADGTAALGPNLAALSLLLRLHLGDCSHCTNNIGTVTAAAIVSNVRRFHYLDLSGSGICDTTIAIGPDIVILHAAQPDHALHSHGDDGTDPLALLLAALSGPERQKPGQTCEV